MSSRISSAVKRVAAHKNASWTRSTASATAVRTVTIKPLPRAAAGSGKGGRALHTTAGRCMASHPSHDAASSGDMPAAYARLLDLKWAGELSDAEFGEKLELARTSSKKTAAMDALREHPAPPTSWTRTASATPGYADPDAFFGSELSYDARRWASSYDGAHGDQRRGEVLAAKGIWSDHGLDFITDQRRADLFASGIWADKPLWGAADAACRSRALAAKGIWTDAPLWGAADAAARDAGAMFAEHARGA